MIHTYIHTCVSMRACVRTHIYIYICIKLPKLICLRRSKKDTVSLYLAGVVPGIPVVMGGNAACPAGRKGWDTAGAGAVAMSPPWVFKVDAAVGAGRLVNPGVDLAMSGRIARPLGVVV